MRTVTSLIQALLFIVSPFSVQDSIFKFRVARATYGIAATADISFEAKEYAATQEDKQNYRSWYNAHILTAESPACTLRSAAKKQPQYKGLGYSNRP